MPGSIPASAQAHVPVGPQQRIAHTDPKTGLLSATGMKQTQQTNQFIRGQSRVIPCSCANTGSFYTLTPNSDGPLLQGYFDYEVFSAVASATSGGSVTATVVPETGALATLKVYKTNGSAQAGAGDLVSGLHYTFTYVDSLDSGAGGFVLR